MARLAINEEHLASSVPIGAHRPAGKLDGPNSRIQRLLDGLFDISGRSSSTESSPSPAKPFIARQKFAEADVSLWRSKSVQCAGFSNRVSP